MDKTTPCTPTKRITVLESKVLKLTRSVARIMRTNKTPKASILSGVYASWLQCKSEYEFEKWLRTQIVNSSQEQSTSERYKLLYPTKTRKD